MSSDGIAIKKAYDAVAQVVAAARKEAEYAYEFSPGAYTHAALAALEAANRKLERLEEAIPDEHPQNASAEEMRLNAEIGEEVINDVIVYVVRGGVIDLASKALERMGGRPDMRKRD